MHFRYITETLNRERKPTELTPLTSSIGPLFSGTYDMSPPPQSPGLPQSRSVSPALHIASSVTRSGAPSYTLNSPPLRTRPSSSSADPSALSQPPQISNPYSSRTTSPFSGFRENNYERPTSLPGRDGFPLSGPSRPSAPSTYSGSGSRARHDGTPGHQSSRSYDSSYSFNPMTTPISSYPDSYTYSSQYSQHNNGGCGSADGR